MLLPLTTPFSPSQDGAYYYYQQEPNKTYEDTLLDVYDYAQQENIPFRYILLDSWWYASDTSMFSCSVQGPPLFLLLHPLFLLLHLPLTPLALTGTSRARVTV